MATHALKIPIATRVLHAWEVIAAPMKLAILVAPGLQKCARMGNAREKIKSVTLGYNA
jgi:hypothetical protein